MNLLAQTIANGFVLSAIYILVAIGFALIFSMMQVLNFAHGTLYMAGGYVSWFWAGKMGLPTWLAVLLAALVLGIVGVILERVCFRPLERDFNRTLMLALAIIIILETTADITVGGYVKRVPALVHGLVHVGGVGVSRERIAACGIAAALLLALTYVINKTAFGRQMLAVAQDRDAAALQGINVHRICAVGFGLSCGLAAVAGGLMGSIGQLGSYMGDNMLVKAITLVIIAGMGSIGGLFVSGLIIGFADAILPLYMPGAASEAVALAFAILILLIRPQGLFGQEI